ncbi:single-stranded-DNA-specific exonuclease RecJ [Lactobacillaceae bacterium 24-114]
MAKERYKWKNIANTDEKLVAKLSQQLKINPVISRLLIERGASNAQEVEKFLHPSLTDIKDPSLLHDMDKAVSRIEQAVENGEQITVYGDYDADGITSTSLMYEALITVGANVNYYVPNRFIDGYGPNAAAYQKIIDNGTTLIITVDNGVSGKKVIDPVVEQGIDVVITDHHELPEELPNAFAIVHPHYPGHSYDYADLSGVGVAFKVAWALLGEFPEDLLDLLAIGEIADVVGVTGENRPLISFGIQKLRQGLRPGLHELMKNAGINEQTLIDQDIGFGIAPRLNALGRIGDANQGVELLTTLDEETGAKLATVIEEANSKRQELVANIMNEVRVKAATSEIAAAPVNIILGHNWHQGVLGIVASRIMDETGKPTIIASVDDGSNVAKGSGRSIEQFNLFTALDKHRDLMTSFGGHPAACGLSFEVDQLKNLQEALTNEAQVQGYTEKEKQILTIATKLKLSDINMDLYEQLMLLSPFGPGNVQPVFEVDPASITSVVTMGKDNSHLKFNLEGENQQITTIAFNKGKIAPYLANTDANVKLAVKLGINEWRGKRSLQLLLEDLSLESPLIIDRRTNKLAPRLFNAEGYYLAYDEKLRENIKGHLPAGMTLSPEEAVEMDLSHVNLTIVDCPPSLDDLEKVFANNHDKPQSIRLLLFQPHSAYLTGMPNREEFAKLYRSLAAYKQINLNQRLKDLSQELRLNSEQLIFMLRVFSAAGFVTIKNGVLKLISNAKKTDLQQTAPYQQRLAQYRAEQTLLFSDRSSLSEWILNCLNKH